MASNKGADGSLCTQRISQALYNQVGNPFIFLTVGSKIHFQKEPCLLGEYLDQLEGEILRPGRQLRSRLREGAETPCVSQGEELV